MSHPTEADWVRRQAEIMRQRAENYDGWLARLEKEK